MSCLCAAALLAPPALLPASPAFAQAQDGQAGESQEFGPEQLDALLAPVALYPDPLLTPLLMATTVPLEVVQAARWVKEPANAALKGDALVRALEAQTWDPSVKALVPFPDVLAMMNDKLDWMQQVGYAFATQQADVMDSVQRLRRQAQAAGTLKSTEQQVVSYAQDAPVPQGAPPPIVIQPASPDVVFVPAYNPATAFGAWPYPTYPPVVFPPPPFYGVGTALATGLAFGAGIAITASLWNVATPNWGRGNVNVNVNRWNSVNVHGARINNAQWRPPARPAGGAAWRPPAGPVGAPRRTGGLPPNAVGRQNVRVPSNLVQRPQVNAAQAANRPAAVANRQTATANRQTQAANRQTATANRQTAVANRQTQVANRQASAPRQQPPAFGNMNQGRNASQFANRGAQSRQVAQAAPRPRPAGGGGGGGGGGGHVARHR